MWHEAGAGARLFPGIGVYQLWHHGNFVYRHVRRVALWFRLAEHRVDAGIDGVLRDFPSGFLSVRPIIVAVARLFLRSSGRSAGDRGVAAIGKSPGSLK